MGKADSNYQVVYRGQSLGRFINGGWVFFQRPKCCGGGYWLGRTYIGVFIIEYERPVSLHEGIKYLLQMEAVERKAPTFDDNFTLF